MLPSVIKIREDNKKIFPNDCFLSCGPFSNMKCMFYSLMTFAFFQAVSAQQENPVTYFLYKNQNIQDYVKIDPTNVCDEIIRDGGIILLIHGWTESHEVEWYKRLTEAFLTRNQNNNVIQVDWSPLSKLRYSASAYDTREIGKIIGTFVRQINEECGISLLNFHVVGHSLGGQVAGFVGKTVLEISRSKIHRITALDPAGPFFAGILVSYRHRLNKFDADIVVVIHTDAGKFGYLQNCGSVDIFPNGGAAHQPGCPNPPRNDTSIFCSHQRSYEYFIEAVASPKTLIATECLSYIAYLMGFCTTSRRIDVGGDITEADKGTYYLTTNPTAPYGKGSNK